ncbi:BspA family leucine-rich repeat surface protein, partial [Helicobacter pullorum]|uniref:BspA family leucine-rich repeat surface protein n=1 Tax=Helicobacter pullorum TaxID=35818 RepID=UPI000A54213F
DWDVSKVESMAWMFNGAESFNADISGWDVSGVKYMSNMFNGAISFNQDISKWDVSKVESIDDETRDFIRNGCSNVRTMQ